MSAVGTWNAHYLHLYKSSAVRNVLITDRSKVIGMRSMMCFPPMLTVFSRFCAVERYSMVVFCSLVLPCRTASRLESQGLDKNPILMSEVC
jgi:hypothetical protein